MKNKLFNKSVSMKTKSLKPIKDENTSEPPQSDSLTEGEAIAWFDETYRMQSKVEYNPFLAALALDFFTKAAAEGNPEAQCRLGLLYITGSLATMPNRPRGLELLESAFEGGNIAGAYCLARIYEKSNNEEQSVKWYHKAAEGRHPAAQYHLGLRYQEGCGVEKNEEMALEYLIKSAKQGHKLAQSWVKAKRNEAHDSEKDETKTLLSPLRSVKDEEEKSSRVAALLSPRTESRSSAVNEPLSPKRNRKPSMVKGGGLSPQMVRSLFSPKREKSEEESGKTSTREGVSPKRGTCTEDAIPELTLGRSSSMKDSGQLSNSHGAIRKRGSPRKSSFTAWGLLSPKKDNRREDGISELTLGNPSSIKDPCQSIEESPRLSNPYGSIRRKKPPQESAFFNQKGTGGNREDDISGFTLVNSSSMKGPCQSIKESPRLSNSYGSIRRRKPPRESAFFAPKINADDTRKGGLSNSLQLSFELGNKK